MKKVITGILAALLALSAGAFGAVCGRVLRRLRRGAG